MVHFNILRSIFRQVENLEKYIAKKNNRLEKHNRKWTDSIETINVIEYVNDYVTEM